MRSIRIQNDSFNRNVGKHVGGKEFLMAVGFTHVEGHLTLMPEHEVKSTLLAYVVLGKGIDQAG